MAYKLIENQLKYYYKISEKRLKYQREYDKNNKDKKRAYDKKRKLTTDKSIKEAIQDYSRNHYFNILLKLYDGCQICKSKNRLEIHHKKYTKDIKDCILVCQSCHKKIHRKYNNDIIINYNTPLFILRGAEKCPNTFLSSSQVYNKRK